MKNILIIESPTDLRTVAEAMLRGQVIVLANDNANEEIADVLALENELALDNDGWALLAPFGEHLHRRLVKDASGSITQETHVQIFDEQAIDAVLANERGEGLFARLKHALIKRPIFEGHPDLKLYSPETVRVANEQLIPLGLNDSSRRTARGLEFKPQLTPDGAKAVEQRGCKYPSGIFLFKKTGKVRDDGAVEVRPFKLVSIGLTPHPNISGVDSLSNEKPNTPAARTETENTTAHMKQILIGWLAAQGIALANDATDQAVFDAFNKEMLTRSTSITTLANDKTTLTGTVNTITSDRDKEKKRADDAVIALANEQTAFKAERKARVEAVVDLRIGQGKLDVAGRDAKVNELVALANDKLTEALTALDALPVKFKVTTALANDRKTDANATVADASKQVLTLANSDERYKGLPFTPELFEQILKDNPSLREQLNQKPGATTATK